MTDLIKEVLRSNELRMNEDYSYTMNNGEVQINQPSLEIALDVGQSMTPGLSLSGVGSAIAKGVDATVEGVKGVAKGVPIGLSNFAKEFNKTFLRGMKKTLCLF